jgi:hypothetical protein
MKEGIEKSTIKSLLNHTKTQVRFQKEREIIRGESFNVFEVLNVKSNETRLHSAFIAELLNPKGMHLKGDIFLKLFLSVIEYPFDFQTSNSTVKIEKTIGSKEVAVDKEGVEHILGGRIDLYVSDKSGKNLAIENKIYASDQPNQLERYANFNQRKDSLYYLTLNGEEPSDLGKGNLKDDEFELISYREHILKWLEQCHKEASDIPILRENIRQYILIIKKLTKQMDDNLKANIDDLLFEEFEAAAYIKDRFDSLLYEYREKFRDSFSEMLRSKLSKMKGLSFQLYDSDAITKKFSHIWIETENPLKLTFGIETFSGNPGGHDNGSLFIGLYRYKTELDDKKLKFNELHPVYWPHHLKLKWKNENDQEITTSLNDANFLKKLFKNKSGFYEKTLEDLTDQSIRFIKETFEILK